VSNSILNHFHYHHLPPHLQAISSQFHAIAAGLNSALPDSAEKSAGLRKLLEAKDCMVRAAVENADFERTTTQKPPEAIMELDFHEIIHRVMLDRDHAHMIQQMRRWGRAFAEDIAILDDILTANTPQMDTNTRWRFDRKVYAQHQSARRIARVIIEVHQGFLECAELLALPLPSFPLPEDAKEHLRAAKAFLEGALPPNPDAREFATEVC